ncbi:ZIP family metal transporter [Halococcus salsus]|uniref:ZIP family metal transporter n=1 Tax=Halococcus salsus TaxID=2162894 RepID=UPI00186579B2|nr:ZIP family metal transporter [Halococcus salsus]
MRINESSSFVNSGRPPWVGVGATAAFVVLSGLGAVAGLWKVLVIGWVAFVAMAGAAVVARVTVADPHPRRVVWSYGLASGAMVTSAAVFLVPQAVGYDPQVGGFGVAAGLLAGYAGHVIGHRFSHRDLPIETTTAQLTAHALTAGLVIGAVYSLLPDLGLLLGLGIVSHKGPAGYAAARRLRTKGRSVGSLLLPAAGVGITATAVGLLDPSTSMVANAAVFGFAAGIFLHIAMDFLPECEVGSEVAALVGKGEDDHALLDRLRIHGVASTAVGAGAVFLAWLVVG